jgi:Fe-S oxidoreductase
MPLPIGTVYMLEKGEYLPVILKSQAMKVYMERDGMTEEDALDHWSYNMEGTNSSALCVDDTISQSEIAQNMFGEDYEPMTDLEEMKHIEETAKIQGIDEDLIW